MVAMRLKAGVAEALGEQGDDETRIPIASSPARGTPSSSPTVWSKGCPPAMSRATPGRSGWHALRWPAATEQGGLPLGSRRLSDAHSGHHPLHNLVATARIDSEDSTPTWSVSSRSDSVGPSRFAHWSTWTSSSSAATSSAGALTPDSGM